MKIWNVIFTGHQPFQAQQIVFAETEEEAKSGIKELLSEKIPGLEIVEIKDITQGAPEESPTTVTMN